MQVLAHLFGLHEAVIGQRHGNLVEQHNADEATEAFIQTAQKTLLGSDVERVFREGIGKPDGKHAAAQARHDQADDGREILVAHLNDVNRLDQKAQQTACIDKPVQQFGQGLAGRAVLAEVGRHDDRHRFDDLAAQRARSLGKREPFLLHAALREFAEKQINHIDQLQRKGFVGCAVEAKGAARLGHGGVRRRHDV